MRPIQEIRRDIANHREHVSRGGKVRDGALRELEAELRAASRPVKATWCPRCKTSGTPGTRCKCPPRRAGDDGIPFYNLTPGGQATRSKPVHVQAPFNIGSTRLRAFESGALSAEFIAHNMSRGTKRDLAQAVVESRDDLPTSFVDRQIELLRTFTENLNGTILADEVLATWTKGYRALWHKSMTHSVPAWTEDEKRYLDLYHELMPRASIRAMAEGSSGGLAIPPDIVSSIIISATLDDAAILAYSPPRWTTSDVWKGISTAGSGFTLPGEGVVVADNTPTFTQPSVTIFAAKDFIPFSKEIGADYPDFANEMGRLFGAEYRDRISNDTAVGAGGSTAPEGIFTRMAATTAGSGAAHVTVTTAGSIVGNDVRALWAALPERAKNDPTCAWLMSNSVFSQISSLAAPSVTNGLAPEDVKHVPGVGSYIFGKPVIYSSYAPAFTGTTGAANYTVVGSFSRYAIVQSVGGLTSELVPQLLDFSGGTGRPTGQSGYLAIARYGAECLDTASFRLLANS